MHAAPSESALQRRVEISKSIAGFSPGTAGGGQSLKFDKANRGLSR